MNDPKDMELVQREAGSIAKQNADPILPMLQSVIDRGVTAENVAALEKLADLYERMQTKAAEQAFNAAFVALQKEMPKVKATEPVPNNDGSTRYMFAPYEKIMEQVQPYLVKHGFTISFSTRYDGPRIVKICSLRHTAGHCVTNEFAVRIGSGPPKASEAQADGAAGTYAKRMALCDSLNIVVEKMDDDARAEGDFITKEQAVSLKHRVMDTGSDEAAFLRYAGAPDYESIREAKYSLLDASLKKKERP